MLKFEYDGYKNTGSQAFGFAVADPAGTDSDLLYTGTDIVDADATVYVDGSSVAGHSISAPSGAYKSITLAQAQTNGDNIFIVIHDASGTVYRDTIIMVRTVKKIGQIIIDPTNIGGNTTGLTVTGVGTAAAITATGGTTATSDISGRLGGVLTSHVLTYGTISAAVDSTHAALENKTGTSTSDDYYNGAIIALTGGTGAGQARVIIDYVGSTKRAEITAAHPWATPPGIDTTYIIVPGADVWNQSLAELTSLPTPTDAAGPKLQLIFQRFAFKVTEDVTTQKWYNSSGTEVFSRTVDDDGTTQTINALT